MIDFTDFHLYSGLGGAAAGFQRARINMEGVEARFRCLGGIDFDRAACADFQRLTGVQATHLDLFDREQYEAFYGKPPGPGWREAGPDDIRRAAGGEAPDVLFSSPPCKGFSALLSGSKAASARYQALNRLTLRGLWLALEAFKDQPPKIILLENVPLIQTRGRRFLDQIVATLRDAGYAVAETVHDCGEIGGLAQTRKRFLLVARHMRQVPPFLYQPHKRPLRGVGEVLGRLPLPGDPYGGPMHAIRRLHWMTWVRLALIPAGKDWRALQGLRVDEAGMLEDFSIEPLGTWFRGALGVADWQAPSGCVTGDARPGKGPFAVADPRAAGWGGRGLYRVTAMDEPVGTVIAASSTGGGAFAAADPRPPYGGEYGQLGVREWDQPAGTVTGQGSPGQGPISIADPRFDWHPDAHRMKYRVAGWDRPASTVIAKSGHPASGGLSVADPRTGLGPGTHSNVYRITGFEQPAPVITSAGRPAAGGGTVADPHTRAGVPFFNVYRVIDWTERATAVTGSGGPGGGVAVADPWLGAEVRQGSLGVREWLQHVGTVSGRTHASNGAYGGGGSARTATPTSRRGCIGPAWPGASRSGPSRPETSSAAPCLGRGGSRACCPEMTCSRRLLCGGLGAPSAACTCPGLASRSWAVPVGSRSGLQPHQGGRRHPLAPREGPAVSPGKSCGPGGLPSGRVGGGEAPPKPVLDAAAEAQLAGGDPVETLRSRPLNKAPRKRVKQK